MKPASSYLPGATPVSFGQERFERKTKGALAITSPGTSIVVFVVAFPPVSRRSISESFARIQGTGSFASISVEDSAAKIEIRCPESIPQEVAWLR
jgi:hypothetical protein